MPYDILIGRDKSDKLKFKERGLVYIGKGYVTMGQYTSLSNLMWLDVARSHVIMVAGKRGSGKCLHGDTLISLADGSQVPIKDLEDNKERVISLNNKLKIERAKRTEFFSREVDTLLNIRLRSGKEIKLTPEHPLFTIKGWLPAQDLKIGSRIATPRKSLFGSNSMPKHEIKLLAYLMAEGHTKSVVLFSNSEDKIVEDLRNSLTKFDPSLELKRDSKYCYRISSPKWKNKILEQNHERDLKGHFLKGNKNKYEKRSIRKLIEREKMFGLLATEKYVSESILKLNKKSSSLFLNRLFSCDGSIYKKGKGERYTWQISYCSSSKKMIRQIQSLLLKFEILSKLREKKINLNGKEFKSFELVLDSENVIRFIEEIGFFGKKQEREFEAKQDILSKMRNPNVDTIPQELWDTYKPENWAKIGRAFGYKYPKAMRERIKYSPSRQTLLKIAEVEKSRPLYLLATSDIFWDEIVSIESLNGKFKVYDLCIPKNHNFIANDIIVHNSYTLGVIAEELCDLDNETSKNIAPLIFDTMGIFWTMKFKNDKEAELLQEWNLKPKNLPVVIWAPYGKFTEYEKRQIPVDKKFALSADELSAEDWILTFGLNMMDPVSIAIQQAISKMGKEYTIRDIIFEINKSDIDHQTKLSSSALFEVANTWGIFAEEKEQATKIQDLIQAGKSTILDISTYSSIGTFNVRALVIGLVTRKIFQQRMLARKKEELLSLQQGADYLNIKGGREMPLVWIFLDESHEFLPLKGKTAATDSLIQLLREGRQPGLSLVMATQQPGAIHMDAMTQSDIVIAHRVTAKPDIEALNSIMQTYLLSSIRKSMDELPSMKGSALVLDDNSERIYPIRMRPRFTWHGGEAPASIKVEKKAIG